MMSIVRFGSIGRTDISNLCFLIKEDREVHCETEPQRVLFPLWKQPGNRRKRRARERKSKEEKQDSCGSVAHVQTSCEVDTNDVVPSPWPISKGCSLKSVAAQSAAERERERERKRKRKRERKKKKTVCLPAPAPSPPSEIELRRGVGVRDSDEGWSG